MPADPSEVRVAVVESRLDNHEKICAERYGEIGENFKTVTSKLDNVLYSVIGFAVVIIGWLLVNGRPWEKVG